MNLTGSVILLLFVILIVVGGFFIISRMQEDTWDKDNNGIWVKHGNPSTTPEKVSLQQEAINCSLKLFQEKKLIMNFSSQCLGTCGNYAVDIVHVPRTSEDNLVENQCEDYRNGKVNKFIELDNSGMVVRVVD